MKLHGSSHLARAAIAAAAFFAGVLSSPGQSVVEFRQVSDPTGFVNQTATVETGTEVTSVTAPETSGDYSFIHWTLDGTRQSDGLGRALQSFSFTILEPTTITAHYLPTTRDSDGDGIEDWYEWRYFGGLSRDGDDDSDGDGFPLRDEKLRGYDPLIADSIDEGGISRRISSAVELIKPTSAIYRWVSSPAGIIDESHSAGVGTVVDSPDLWGDTSSGRRFARWEIDGAVQSDSSGRALGALHLTLTGSLTATAVYLPEDGDSDVDGVPDWYEWNYFSGVGRDGTDDPDGDGWSVAAEFARGYDPSIADSIEEGGVSRRVSDAVTINLQFFERMSFVSVSGRLERMFSFDPHAPDGFDFGDNAAPVLVDWDGDGDKDLFVAHEDGLRVFRNSGTEKTPDYEEITDGFGGLSAFVAAIDHPVLAGGDWNGDGLGDLIVGGDVGTLRLLASPGAFSSDGSGVDFPTGSASARPALGDMNGDGRPDLLVLLADGSVRLYLHNGSPVPFADPGVDDYLGVPAPNATGIAVADVNQDGLADVLLADAEGRIWEFHRNADGGFTLKSKVWGGSGAGFGEGLVLAATDFDTDGDADMLVGLANGAMVALRDPGVGRPSGLSAAAGAESIQLDWDADRQSRIRGYFVYRTTDVAGPWDRQMEDWLPLPGFLDTAVAPANTYHYRVTAVSYYLQPGNSEPRMVESPPSEDVSASPGSVKLCTRPVRGRADHYVKVPLAIDNSLGLRGQDLQIKVSYDPAVLTPATQADASMPTVLTTGLSRGLGISDNAATAHGELILTGDSGEIAAGSGMLFALRFKVNDTASPGQTTPVSISFATMYSTGGNPVAVDFSGSGVVEVADTFFPGDVNGDGLVTELDEALLKILAKPEARHPAAGELQAGDLNGDGKLDQKDLLFLKRMLAGLDENDG